MKHLICRQLDKKLDPLRSISLSERPTQGWIKTIRHALGITRKQLGERLGLTPQSVYSLENYEKNNSITLNTLEKAANALNCRLYYVVIPHKPLQDMVDEAMSKKAAQMINSISHSMALEKQEIGKEEQEAQIQELVEMFKNKKNISFIWNN